MLTFHADGGASVNQVTRTFYNAYITVVDDFGNVIVHKRIGDFWSGVAEFLAIKWVVKNIDYRPIRITSDCQTALSWARKGANSRKFKCNKLNLSGVRLEYMHGNLADQYNAVYVSPKISSGEFYRKWLKEKHDRIVLEKDPNLTLGSTIL